MKSDFRSRRYVFISTGGGTYCSDGGLLPVPSGGVGDVSAEEDDWLLEHQRPSERGTQRGKHRGIRACYVPTHTTWKGTNIRATHAFEHSGLLVF